MATAATSSRTATTLLSCKRLDLHTLTQLCIPKIDWLIHNKFTYVRDSWFARARRYFVAAGVIAAVCSAAGLYLCAVNARPGALVPLLAQGFLFSAAGAAFASRGNAWSTENGGEEGGSVCYAAGAFCGRVTIAAVVGTAAASAVTVAALASKGWGLRRR
jgi:hypothetical protein